MSNEENSISSDDHILEAINAAINKSDVEDSPVQSENIVGSEFREELEPRKSSPSLTSWQFFMNILITLEYGFCYLCMGLVISSLGWSNFRLQQNTGVSIQAVGWLFTIRGIAWIIGCTISGKILDLVSSKSNKLPFLTPHLFMNISMSVLALCSAIIPILTNYWILAVFCFVIGIFGGMIDLVPNVLIMRLWKEKSAPVIQFLHFCFGIGAFLSPFIAGLFQVSNLERFCWAYWVLSIGCLLAMIPLLFLPTLEFHQTEEVEKSSKEQWNTVFLGVVIGAFLGFYVGTEVAYGGFIYDFLIEKKLMDEVMAAYATSVYWLSFTIGRGVSVFVAMVLSANWIMSLGLCMAIGSMVFLVIFPSNLVVIWICTIIYGFSLAPLYPTAIGYPATNLNVEVTGAMTSIMQIGASMGEVCIPALVGFLFSPIGPNSLFYTMLAILVGALAIYFVLMFAFKKRVVEKGEVK
jgi:FHS family Na+ dependent glucose MFS transporter 1